MVIIFSVIPTIANIKCFDDKGYIDYRSLSLYLSQLESLRNGKEKFAIVNQIRSWYSKVKESVPHKIPITSKHNPSPIFLGPLHEIKYVPCYRLETLLYKIKYLTPECFQTELIKNTFLPDCRFCEATIGVGNSVGLFCSTSCGANGAGDASCQVCEK